MVLFSQHTGLRRSWKVTDIFQAGRKEKGALQRNGTNKLKTGRKVSGGDGQAGDSRGWGEHGVSRGSSCRPAILSPGRRNPPPCFQCGPVCNPTPALVGALLLLGLQCISRSPCGVCKVSEPSSLPHITTEENQTQATWKARPLKDTSHLCL